MSRFDREMADRDEEERRDLEARPASFMDAADYERLRELRPVPTDGHSPLGDGCPCGCEGDAEVCRFVRNKKTLRREIAGY